MSNTNDAFDKAYESYKAPEGAKLDLVKETLKQNNISAEQFEQGLLQQGGTDISSLPQGVVDANLRPDLTKMRYSYNQSAMRDLGDSMYNSAVLRTGEAFKMAIPQTAAALGFGLGEDKNLDGKIDKSEQGWSADWIDETIDWYEKSAHMLSTDAQTGEGINIFSDEFNANAFAATFGQGLGSVVPVIAASLTGAALAKVTGGTSLAAAGMTIARLLPFLAGTSQIAPTIVEEGLAKGLTHQEASAASMVISPIVGAIEAIGVGKVLEAGTKPLTGSIARQVFSKEIDEIAKVGLNPRNFKQHASNIFRNTYKAASAKGGFRQALKQEAKLYGKAVGLSTATGGAIEFVQESTQSLVETLGKEIFDKQFARPDAKFGYKFMSEDTFVRAFKEGILGGLVGGFVGGTTRGLTSWQHQSMFDALDSAAQQRKGDTQAQQDERVQNVLDNIYSAIEENQEATPSQKQSLRDAATDMAGIVKTGVAKHVKNTPARMQLNQLSLIKKRMNDKIADIDINNDVFANQYIAEKNKALLEPMNARLDMVARRIVLTGKPVDDINAVFDFTDEQVAKFENWTKEREELFNNASALDLKMDMETAQFKTIIEEAEDIVVKNSRIWTDKNATPAQKEMAYNAIVQNSARVDQAKKAIAEIEADYANKKVESVKDLVERLPEIQKEIVAEATPAFIKEEVEEAKEKARKESLKKVESTKDLKTGDVLANEKGTKMEVTEVSDENVTFKIGDETRVEPIANVDNLIKEGKLTLDSVPELTTEEKVAQEMGIEASQVESVVEKVKKGEPLTFEEKKIEETYNKMKETAEPSTKGKVKVTPKKVKPAPVKKGTALTKMTDKRQKLYKIQEEKPGGINIGAFYVRPTESGLEVTQISNGKVLTGKLAERAKAQYTLIPDNIRTQLRAFMDTDRATELLDTLAEYTEALLAQDAQSDMTEEAVIAEALIGVKFKNNKDLEADYLGLNEKTWVAEDGAEIDTWVQDVLQAENSQFANQDQQDLVDRVKQVMKDAPEGTQKLLAEVESQKEIELGNLKQQVEEITGLALSSTEETTNREIYDAITAELADMYYVIEPQQQGESYLAVPLEEAYDLDIPENELQDEKTDTSTEQAGTTVQSEDAQETEVSEGTEEDTEEEIEGETEEEVVSDSEVGVDEEGDALADFITASDVFGLDEDSTEDEGVEEGGVEMDEETRAVLEALGNKHKKGRIGYQSKISDDPVLFQAVYEQIKKIFPKVDIKFAKKLVDENGIEVLGSIKDFEVLINENEATQDTLVHEVGHKYFPLLAGTKLYSDLMEVIADTQYHKDVMEAYKGETSEDIREEAVLNLIATKTVDEIKEKVGNKKFAKVKSLLRRFWNTLKYRIGLASAEDMAQIVASKVAWGKQPIVSSGVSITQTKYSRQFTNDDFANLNLIRDAYQITALNLVKKGRKFKKKDVGKAFRNSMAVMMKAAGFTPDTAKSFVEKEYSEVIKKYMNRLNDNHSSVFAEDELEAAVNSIANDVVYEGDLETANAQEAASMSFESSKLSKNVAFIIEGLTDIEGNGMDKGKVFNIAIAAGAKSAKVEDFLGELDKLADSLSDFDQAVAKNLHHALENLPEGIQKPIIRSLYSLDAIPSYSLRMFTDGNGVLRDFTDVSTRPIPVNESKRLVNSIIRNKRYLAYRRGKVSQQRRRAKVDMLEKLATGLWSAQARKANEVSYKHPETGKRIKDSYRNVQHQMEQLVKELMGVSIKPVHFLSKTADEVDILAGINENLEYKKAVTDYTGFITTFVKQERELDDRIGKQGELTQMDFVKYLTGDMMEEASSDFTSSINASINKVINNISTRTTAKRQSLDVVGHQIANDTIGGWANKFFRTIGITGLDLDFIEHPAFSVFKNPQAVFKMYKDLYTTLSSQNKPIVGKFDGIRNQDTHQGRKYKDLYEEDVTLYNFLEFVRHKGVFNDNKGIYQKGTNNYNQSLGLLADRDFQLMIKAPVMLTETAQAAISKIQAKYKGSDAEARIGGYIPSLEVAEQAIEYLDNVINNPDLTMSSTLTQQIHPDDLADLVEQYVYNDMFNRWMLANMIAGDLTKFKSEEDITKRIAGATSPQSVVEQVDDIDVYVIDDYLLDGRIDPQTGKPIDDTEVSDAAVYYNDVISHSIVKSGGAVEQLGNTFKPIVYTSTPKGDFTYIKQGGFGFNVGKNYDQSMTPEQIDQISDPVKKSIAKILARTNEQGKPAAIVFRSAIKSNQKNIKGYKDIAELMGAVTDLEKGGKSIADLTPSMKLPKNALAIQLNMHKEVSNKKVDMAFGTQMRAIISSFSTPEQQEQWESLYSQLVMKNYTDKIEGTKVLKGAKRIIDSLENFSASQKGTTGGRILHFLKNNLKMLPESVTFDHFDISLKVQNSIANKINKLAGRTRVNGAELVQSPDLSGKLTDMWENGTAYGEVRVPRGFAKKGDTIIAYRIPTSAHVNLHIAKVVGYTEIGSNRIDMPQNWIKRSDSDHDGDKMFTWKRDTNNEAEQRLFDYAEQLLTDPSVRGRFDNDLDIQKANAWIDKAHKDLGIDSPVVKDGKGWKLGKGLPMSTVSGYMKAAASVKHSAKLIGVMATTSKMMNYLSMSGIQLEDKLEMFGLKLDGKKGKTVTNENIDDVAIVLQLMLDNAKYLTAGYTGITKSNAGVATTLMMFGHSVPDVFTYMLSEPIAEISKMLEKNNNSIFLKKAFKDEAAIINEVEKRMGDNKYTIKGEEVSGKTLINNYKKASDISRLLSHFRSVVQLDKGVPKDVSSFLDIFESFSRIRYEQDLHEKGVNKIMPEGVEHFLTRPIIATYGKLLRAEAKQFNQYFSSMSTDGETIKEFSRTLKSFRGISTSDRAGAFQKGYTQALAEAIFLENDYVNAEAAAADIRATLDRLMDYKYASTEEGTGAEFWANVDPDPDALKLHMNKGTIADLELDKYQDLDFDLLETQWEKLPSHQREDLIKFAVLTNGFTGNNTIAALLGKSVWTKYFQNKAKYDKGHSDLMRDVAAKMHESLVSIDRADLDGLNGIESGSSVTFKKVGKKVYIPPKFFKMDGVIYESQAKKTGSGKTTGDFIATAYYRIKPSFEITVEGSKVINTINYQSTNLAGKPALDLKYTQAQSLSKDYFEKYSVDPGQDGELDMLDVLMDGLETDSAPDKNTSTDESTDDTFGQLGLEFQVADEKSTMNHKAAQRIFRRLGRKHGIATNVINDPQLKVAGFYDHKNDVAVINLAYVKPDTPFHEIIHPFTKAIKKQNKPLYDSLVKELKNTVEGQKIIEETRSKYKGYTEEQILEESVNEAVGRQAKISSESLATKIKMFLKEALMFLKDLFGVETNALMPKEIKPNTTIAQLANAIVNDKVSLDGKIDVQARRRIAMRMKSLNKKLAKGFKIAHANNIVGKKNRTIRENLAKQGLMLNDNFIVYDSRDMKSDYVVKFRVPEKLGKNWIGAVQKAYPMAAVVDVAPDSDIFGYDKVYVDLGNGDTVVAYKYNGDMDFTPQNAFKANVMLQKAGSTKRGTVKNDNIFSGADIDKKETGYAVSEMPKYQNSLADMLFAILDAEGYNRDDAMLGSFKIEEHEIFEETIINAVDSLLGTVVKEYKNATRGNAHVKDMSSLLNVEKLFNLLKDTKNQIRKIENVDNRQMALKEYQNNLSILYDLIRGQKNRADYDALFGYGADSLHIYDTLLTLHAVGEYHNETKDKFISTEDSGDVIHTTNVNKVVNKVVDSIFFNKQKREDFLNKYKILKPFKMLMDWGSKVSDTVPNLNYKYNQLLPNTMANIMTGNISDVLHTLLYESPNKGETRAILFDEAMNKALEDAIGAEAMQRVANTMSTVTGRKESEMKFMKVGVVQKNGQVRVVASMPKMRALMMYKTLKQRDLFARMFPTETSRQEFVIGKTDGTMDGRKPGYAKGHKFSLNARDAQLFIKSFEEQHGDMVEVSKALDNMFDVARQLLNPTFKKIHGIDMPVAKNYFPLLTGVPTRGLYATQQLDQSMTLEFGSLYERSDSYIGTAIRLEDALEVVQNYRMKAANYYAYANDITNLYKLADAIKARHQDTYVEMEADKRDELHNIEKYIVEYADGLNNYRAIMGMTDTAFEKGMQNLLNNFQVAVLGLNPWVMFKQPVSLLASVPELGDFEIFSGEYLAPAFKMMGTSMKKVQLNPKDMKFGELDLENENIVEMMDLIPIIRQRFQGYIDREMGEFTQAKINPYAKQGKKTKIPLLGDVDTSKFLEGIRIFDAAAVTAIYLKVKDDVYGELQSGTKEEKQAEIKKRVENIINKTQPTYGMVNRTNFGRTTNPLFRLFTLFSTQRAKNLNIMIDAFNACALDPSEENRMKLKLALVSVGLLSSLSIAAINTMRSFLYGGWDDEEWAKTMAKDMFADTLGTFVGNAYGGGTVFEPIKNFVLERPFGQSIEHPVLQTFGQGLKGVGQVGTGKFGRGAYNITNTMFKLYGLPTTPLTVGKKVTGGVSSLVESKE